MFSLSRYVEQIVWQKMWEFSLLFEECDMHILAESPWTFWPGYRWWVWHWSWGRRALWTGGEDEQPWRQDAQSRRHVWCWWEYKGLISNCWGGILQSFEDSRDRDSTLMSTHIFLCRSTRVDGRWGREISYYSHNCHSEAVSRSSLSLV